MKKYLVKINYEKEVFAEDKDEAVAILEDDLAKDNDSIWHYAEIKAIEKGKNKLMKALNMIDELASLTAGEGTEEEKELAKNYDLVFDFINKNA